MNLRSKREDPIKVQHETDDRQPLMILGKVSSPQQAVPLPPRARPDWHKGCGARFSVQRATLR
jgi:hypothetical protein